MSETVMALPLLSEPVLLPGREGVAVGLLSPPTISTITASSTAAARMPAKTSCQCPSMAARARSAVPESAEAVVAAARVFCLGRAALQWGH